MNWKTYILFSIFMINNCIANCDIRAFINSSKLNPVSDHAIKSVTYTIESIQRHAKHKVSDELAEKAAQFNVQSDIYLDFSSRDHAIVSSRSKILNDLIELAPLTLRAAEYLELSGLKGISKEHAIKKLEERIEIYYTGPKMIDDVPVSIWTMAYLEQIKKGMNAKLSEFFGQDKNVEAVTLSLVRNDKILLEFRLHSTNYTPDFVGIAVNMIRNDLANYFEILERYKLEQVNLKKTLQMAKKL
jgi:hypothetical protein